MSNLTVYSTNYFNPAYYGASVSNPIVMQAVWTNTLVDPLNPTAPQLANMAYCDVNGDGKGDLMYVAQPSSTSDPGMAVVWTNGSTGAGNFGFVTNGFALATSYNPTGITTADLDGDGLPDWIYVEYDANSVQIFRNASTPQNVLFAEGNSYFTGNNPYDVKVVDFDGDGKPDLVVANHGDGTVSVYRNLSSGTGNIVFAQKVDFPAGPQPRQLAVGDIDGDGKADIVVVSDSSTTGVSNVVVLRNTSTLGNISFASPVAVATNNEPESVALGDFNMDGKLDLAVGDVAGAFGIMMIYINSSSPESISFPAGVQASSTTVVDPRHIAIGDLNGDGLPDFAVVNSGGSNMWTFQNAWTGGSFMQTSFASVSNYVTGSGVGTTSGYSGPLSVISADLDNDGRPDIAVGNYYTTNVVIYQNVSQY